MSRARAFAVACDKDVTVSKDVPGFVSNALLMPFINEVIVVYLFILSNLFLNSLDRQSCGSKR